MWIKHPHTGRVELVLHEAHITRLLGEGGIEVPSPLELQGNEVIQFPSVVKNKQHPVRRKQANSKVRKG